MKVSVIVPVYNTLDYLPKCVESVLGQTWSDFEMILVDDGSTDGSGACCDEYHSRDSRVLVVHKENEGQGKARNIALDMSKGEYITFLDSDDFLDPDFLEKMIQLIEEEDADISVCGYRYANADYHVVPNSAIGGQERRMFDGISAARIILYENEFNTAPWAKLFKKRIWSEIRFKEDRIYEDLATMYLAFLNANRVAFDATPLMTYVLRPKSDLRMAFNSRKMMTITTVEEIVSYSDAHCREIGKAARCRSVAAGFFIFLQIPREKGIFEAEKKRCVDIIKKYRLGVVLDGEARRKTRVAALMSYFGMSLVRMVFDYMKKRDPVF